MEHHPHRRHVAVCAFPFGTHAAPLLHLVKHLATASPDTRFSFINTATSNSALFATKSDDLSSNIIPCNLKEEEGGNRNGNPFVRFIETAGGSFRRRMEVAEEEAGGVKISCVISDAFLWFCGEIVAEEKEKGNLCSWIAVWTSNVASISAAFHTDVLRTKYGVLKQGFEGKEDELIDCVPGFSNIRVKDILDCVPGMLSETINSPFDQMTYKMGLILPKADAVVVNSFEKLSPTITNDLKSKMKLLCIGPFPSIFPPQIVTDKYDCLPWLDKQKEKSVVYISFGTVATPPPHEFLALVEALEGGEFPFLWSMNDSIKGNLPLGFVDRVKEDEAFGKIVEWAPQMKVLGHPSVGGFVTHCGWNSILESMVNGVPLICRPMLGDQKVNQRFIESVFGVGVGLEGGVFTKSGAIKALRRVLSSDEGEEMRRNVQVLRGLAEESTKQGGSSIENLNALIKLVQSA